MDRVTEMTDEVKRLLGELEKEMALLRGRVDGLEARVGELDAMQFSTTTRLMGVSAMYLNTASGPHKAVSSAVQVLEPGKIGPRNTEPEPLNSALAFQYSTILGLSTSFNGKDLLSVDLYTSNFQPYSSSIFGFTPNLTGTYSTRLSFDAPPYNGRVNIADLFYRFKIGDAITVKATAAGSEVSNELLGSSLPFQAAYPYIQSISRFGRFDPIYYQTLGRPGFSADWQIGNGFNIGGGYFGEFGGVIGGGQAPLPGGKSYSTSQAAIAQLSWFPSPKKVRHIQGNWHTRCYPYVRGCEGVVTVFYGLSEEKPGSFDGKYHGPYPEVTCQSRQRFYAPVYGVRFQGADVFGDANVDPRLTVNIDLWEPHLELA